MGNITTNAQENGKFKDSRDGHVYKTVKIGNQLWMAENLAFKADSGCWAYDNDERNVAKYGYLYNWEMANSVCPLASGWRLPTKNDFETLLKDLGGNNIAYDSLMLNASSGFSTLFGGSRKINGKYIYIGGYAGFWSSTMKDDIHLWGMAIVRQYKLVSMGSNAVKSIGLSVRCIKDN